MNFLYLQIRWMGVLLVLLSSFALEQSAFAELPELEMTSPIPEMDGGEPEEVTISGGVSLEELVSVGLAQNPILSRAAFAVDAARGRAVQAGLYPNPTIGVMFDELGDRTGPAGINSLPVITQEIVLGDKLEISQAAAGREVGQATWRVVAQRYELLANIRTAYFNALTLQRRIEILDQVLQLAEQSVDQTSQLLKAKQVARLDLVQLEVEAQRLLAEREAAERKLPGAYKRLAATVGVTDLGIMTLAGSLEAPLPEYSLEPVQQCVLTTHPEIRVARIEVEQARLLLERAEVEPIPNINVETGYIRQNQNNSDDFRIGASISVPLWNRNQGNIRAAQAEVRRAMQGIRQAENDLTNRVALAMQDFSSASRRAERYRTLILPTAEETYRLSLKAYQGGEFQYLRVLEAQRTLFEARLEYVRALGEAWEAAAVISGLMLQDQWPTTVAEVPPAPASAPQPDSTKVK